MLDQIVDCGHGLAVFLRDLQVELTLAPDEHFAHIECIETKLTEGGSQDHLRWLVTAVVEGDEADDALSDIHRVSVVLALLTRHQHIVFEIGAEGHGGEEASLGDKLGGGALAHQSLHEHVCYSISFKLLSYY